MFQQKFFPTHRTSELKTEILNFKAMEDEKFFTCWERLREMVVACPHHGFDNWILVSYFYEDMSPPMKQLLETMCGGDFMNKNPDEAFQFLDYVVKASRSWEEPIVKESPRNRTMNMEIASGVYSLLESLDVQAKIAIIIRRLDGLEAKKVQKVYIANEGTIQPCLICKSMEQDMHSCPTLPTIQDMFFEQANAIGTYKQPMNSSPYSNQENLLCQKLVQDERDMNGYSRNIITIILNLIHHHMYICERVINKADPYCGGKPPFHYHHRPLKKSHNFSFTKYVSLQAFQVGPKKNSSHQNLT